MSKDLGQPHDAADVAREQLTQDRPRADRRQLIGVSDQDQSSRPRQRLEQMMRELDVQHRGFVDQHEIRLQRSAGVARERPRAGVPLQEPVNGLGLATARVGQALGGASGRGA